MNRWWKRRCGATGETATAEKIAWVRSGGGVAACGVVAALLAGGWASVGCAPGAGKSGSATPAATPLGGTYWKLTSVRGVAAVVDPDKLDGAHLEFDVKTDRVFGSGGVNRLKGSYRVNGETITFAPMAQTRMEGPPELMKQEFAVGRALEEVRTFSISGGNLTLYSATREELVKFTARRSAGKWAAGGAK